MVSESEQPQHEGFQDSYIFTVGWLWASIHCLPVPFYTTYWAAMSVHAVQSVEYSLSDRVPHGVPFCGGIPFRQTRKFWVPLRAR